MAKFSTDTGLELDDSDPEDRKIIRRQRDAARESGRTGGDRAKVARGRADLAAAFDEGAAAAAPASSPAAAGARKTTAAGGAKRVRKAATVTASTVRGLPTPRLRPPRTASARDAGGFLLGLVIHALVLSYIRYGAGGPTGWMKAKFLNQPVQGEDLEGGGDSPEAAEGRIDPTKPIM